MTRTTPSGLHPEALSSISIAQSKGNRRAWTHLQGLFLPLAGLASRQNVLYLASIRGVDVRRSSKAAFAKVDAMLVGACRYARQTIRISLIAVVWKDYRVKERQEVQHDHRRCEV